MHQHRNQGIRDSQRVSFFSVQGKDDSMGALATKGVGWLVFR
jgi:hypothetical protein